MLVAGGNGSVTDPIVSFDGEWVYYSLFHDLEGATITAGAPAGADIYKIHVKTRKIVRLTHQQFTPNTGAADWSKDFRTPEPGKNSIELRRLQHGPLPAARRQGRLHQQPQRLPAAQATAAHAATVRHGRRRRQRRVHRPPEPRHGPAPGRPDGRPDHVQLAGIAGAADLDLWGLWSIHPDGTNWGPLVSAFLPGESPNAFHFQTQLSDGSIVAEEYYNQNNSGFGTFVKLPPQPAGRRPAVRPGLHERPAQPAAARRPPRQRPAAACAACRSARSASKSLTRVRPHRRRPGRLARCAARSDSARASARSRIPPAAPDNHLLTVWSPGPVNGGYTVHVPAVDGGIYLIKDGKPIDEPGQMLLIKNDPNYNEQWPRALVPYKRIYGIDEPKRLAAAGQRRQAVAAPAGGDAVRPGRHVEPVQARELSQRRRAARQRDGDLRRRHDRTAAIQDLDPFNTAEDGVSLNWFNQGADAGLYTNDDIHAIRILALEPTTDRHRGPKSGRPFRSHANERLRILGEIPVRKFRRRAEERQRRRPAARPRRQPRHQLPGQDPRRRGLHVPDARQERHGAEHGPDLAPAPARRDPQRLRRLPRPQPEADPLRGHRRRPARLPRSST